MPEEDANLIDKLLSPMRKFNASDLHIKAGSPPIYRVSGTPRKTEAEIMKPAIIRDMVDQILTDEQRKCLEETGGTDFAYGVRGIGRFRCNVYGQRGSLSLAIRRVNDSVPGLKDLNLPPSLKKLAGFTEGLVLLAGVTGSGKSTTLATIINMINDVRKCHILTIEDPIEYLFEDNLAFINQREVGLDVSDFKTALRTMVRQDPDIVLIGEMRDAETFETALTAAETGHLVFGTIHSSNAPQTVTRLLDLFPTSRHAHMRRMISANIKSVIVQKLVKGTTKEFPRVPACEVMFSNSTIAKLIMDGDEAKIQTVIQGGKEEGMQDFNQSLYDLCTNKKIISEEEAMRISPNPEALKMKFSGINLKEGGVIG